MGTNANRNKDRNHMMCIRLATNNCESFRTKVGKFERRKVHVITYQISSICSSLGAISIYQLWHYHYWQGSRESLSLWQLNLGSWTLNVKPWFWTLKFRVWVEEEPSRIKCGLNARSRTDDSEMWVKAWLDACFLSFDLIWGEINGSALASGRLCPWISCMGFN